MTPYPMFPLLSVKWSLSRGLKQNKRGSEYSDLTWKLFVFWRTTCCPDIEYD